MRTVLCLAAAVLFGVAGTAHAQTVQAGFNDAAGINSNPTTNSPYNIANTPLNGQGVGEPGWFSPWTADATAIVVSTNTAEGDGAVRLSGTSVGLQRITQLPASGITSVEVRFQIESAATLGQAVNLYYRSSGIPNNDVNQGPVWQASADGRWRVVDGNEDTVGVLEDTPFFWTPGAYQTIRMDVNTVTRTWEFFVNGTRYISPDPLGYRGSPIFLDKLDFLSGINAPNGVRLDAISIGAAVPEPSSFVLAGLASAAGLTHWRRKRKPTV